MIVTLLLSVLNAGLLAIPIGGTAGVLAGIDYHRRVTGQEPLFSNPSGGGGFGGGGDSGNGTDDNSTYPGWDGDKPNATVVIGGTTISEYCQQYNEIAINTTDGQNYTVNPNQWGWEESEGGGLCLNVTTFNNETYPTNTTAPKWSATWQYPVGETSQPVHAYPNIMIQGDVLPAQLGSLTELGIDMHWTYTDNKTITVTNTNTTTTTVSNSTTKRAVISVDFSANVAIDMFFDKNATKSQLTSDADYEVMVWFAQFGKYADPIGYSDGIVASQIVDGVNFTLYNGTNSKDQHVLTWISESETNTFNGSIHPLLTSLPNLGLKYSPSSTDYIGYFSFGSEAYYSESTVIFNVLSLEMNVW